VQAATKKLLLSMIVLLTNIDPAHASEAIFGYVYTLDLTPKGGVEYEQWITDREGQAKGHFHDVLMRSEIEYGLTDNLQLSGYLNYSYINANRNSVNGETSGIDIPADHDPTKPFNALRFDTVSAELIWRALSPYTNPIGLGFYVEPEVGPRERAIELRVILQKNFLDDRLITAANVWAELEREDAGGGEIERATMLETDLGISYRFAPKWFAGLEFRNHNEYVGYTVSTDDQEHTAFFIGPVLHYGSEKWWATLTLMHQFKATGFTDEQRDNIRGGLIFGDEHTRFDGIRLAIGIPLI